MTCGHESGKCRISLNREGDNLTPLAESVKPISARGVFIHNEGVKVLAVSGGKMAVVFVFEK